MGRRIGYLLGDEIGTKGCRFFYEIEPRRSGKTQQAVRQAYFKCPQCGAKFLADIGAVRKDLIWRCKECTNKAKGLSRKSQYEIGDYIDAQHNFIYLGEYQDNTCNRKVTVKDIRTGEIFSTFLSGLKTGRTKYAPSVSKKEGGLKNQKYHVGDIINGALFEQELDRYITPNGQIKRVGLFKNLETDKEFICWINSVIYGHSLGLENESLGENTIRKWLEEHNIYFQQEYSFEDLISERGKKLRFDFFIPAMNLLIEYDGIQHFENTFRLPEEEYQYRLSLDKLKDNYAKEHNYTLIRIGYSDFSDISIILSKKVGEALEQIQ